MPTLALSDAQKRSLGALVLFRLITVTVLLGATTYLNLHSAQSWSTNQLVLSFFIGFIYLLSILYLLAIKVNASYYFQATTQVFVDLLFWSCLIYLTDGLRSPFTFLYMLSIIQGAYLLGKRGAFASFGGALFFFLFVIWMEMHGVFHESLHLTPSFQDLWAVDNLYTLFMNLSMLLLVAILAGYLASQIQAREEALTRERLSLEMQRLLNRSIMTSLTTGFAILDLKGHITFLNVSAERLLDVEFNRARNQNLGEFWPELGEFVVRELSGALPERHGELKLTRPDLGSRYISVAASDLLGPDNTRMGTILILDDVTSRRMLEERALRSEKLAAVGELAAGIAHEIRNPLASISGLHSDAQSRLGDRRGQPEINGNLPARDRPAQSPDHRLSGLCAPQAAQARPHQPARDPGRHYGAAGRCPRKRQLAACGWRWRRICPSCSPMPRSCAS